MTNAERTAARFGCTIDQAKAQFAANANWFDDMAEKAKWAGRKVNGYTETQLRAMAARCRNDAR